MNPNDTTQGNDPGRIEPLTLEKFKEILDNLEILRAKNIYMNSADINRILAGAVQYINVYSAIYSEVITFAFGPYLFKIITNDDIMPGQIIYCEPGLYDIWKQLKSSPWIDKNDPTIDLWKAAAALFDSEKQKDKPKPFYYDPEFTMRGLTWPIYDPFKDGK